MERSPQMSPELTAIGTAFWSPNLDANYDIISNEVAAYYYSLINEMGERYACKINCSALSELLSAEPLRKHKIFLPLLGSLEQIPLDTDGADADHTCLFVSAILSTRVVRAPLHFYFLKPQTLAIGNLLIGNCIRGALERTGEEISIKVYDACGSEICNLAGCGSSDIAEVASSVALRVEFLSASFHLAVPDVSGVIPTCRESDSPRIPESANV
jgi:hypothetical protein